MMVLKYGRMMRSEPWGWVGYEGTGGTVWWYLATNAVCLPISATLVTMRATPLGAASRLPPQPCRIATFTALITIPSYHQWVDQLIQSVSDLLSACMWLSRKASNLSSRFHSPPDPVSDQKYTIPAPNIFWSVHLLLLQDWFRTVSVAIVMYSISMKSSNVRRLEINGAPQPPSLHTWGLLISLPCPSESSPKRPKKASVMSMSCSRRSGPSCPFIRLATKPQLFTSRGKQDCRGMLEFMQMPMSMRPANTHMVVMWGFPGSILQSLLSCRTTRDGGSKINPKTRLRNKFQCKVGAWMEAVEIAPFLCKPVAFWVAHSLSWHVFILPAPLNFSPWSLKDWKLSALWRQL